MRHIAIPVDVRVSKKEKKKIENCQELKREIKRMWNIRSTCYCIKELGVLVSTVLLQKTLRTVYQGRSYNCG